MRCGLAKGFDTTFCVTHGTDLAVHLQKQEMIIAQQQRSFESKLAEQETRIESLTSGLQKVSWQVELSELTRQVVLNKQ
jgi:hypothetical protein